LTSRKNLLIDLSELNPESLGGVQNYAVSITSELIRNPRVEVKVLLSNKNSIYLLKKIPELDRNNTITLPNLTLISQSSLRILALIGASKVYIYLKSRRLRIIMNELKVQLIYTPTTHLNYWIKNCEHLVSLHDIQERDLPENFSRKERLYRNFRVTCTLRFANTIHVSSNFIKNTLVKYYPKYSSRIKIFVINEGVDLDYFSNRGGSKQRKFLFPARDWPHKNHKLFFSSLEFLQKENPPSFILTGASKTNLEIFDLARFPTVSALGHVSQEELRTLYTESMAVISCSRYESSSLPILEGIASECIALASSIPSHIEMSESLNIEIFDPSDPSDLAMKIQEITQKYDRRELDYSINNKAIQKYSWSFVARELLDHMVM